MSPDNDNILSQLINKYKSSRKPMVETSPRGDRRRRNRMPEIYRSQANNSNMKSKQLIDSPSVKK